MSEQESSLNNDVDIIRSKFEEELLKNGEHYHDIDVERVRNEEWQVRRYLIDNEDVDKAFTALCQALRWKKSFGIHDRTDQTYPKELWELCGVEVNGKDKQGRLIQWEVFRNQRKFKELDCLARQFVAHNIERVDRMAGTDGFILVMDVGGAGVSNVDLEMIRFKMATIDYYPGGLQKMVVVDLPWLLNPIMTMIINFMNPKLRQMVMYSKKNELDNMMDVKHIPCNLNGKREKSSFPDNLTPMDQMMTEMGLNETFIENFYKTFKLARTNA